MLEKLHNERKDLLKMVGIDISLDELIKLYKNDKCENWIIEFKVSASN